MIRIVISLALCFPLVARALSAMASNDDNPLAGYTERVWQAQDGLPEQIVQAFG